MNKNIKEQLQEYYCENLVKSYICSNDIYKRLRNELPIDISTFLGFLDIEVNNNYEFEHLSAKQVDNIFNMLNVFLLKAIEKQDIETIELCNSMIRTLVNKNSGINYMNSIKELYINTSVYKKDAIRACRSDNSDFSDFLSFYDVAVATSKYLLVGEVDDYSEYTSQICKNEIFFHVVKDMIDRIPDVLQDDLNFIKLSAIFSVNHDLGLPLFVNYPKIYFENKKVFKQLKKTYLKSN